MQKQLLFIAAFTSRYGWVEFLLGVNVALLPVFADLEDQPCLIVGGGEVAWRKSAQLLEAGALLRVNAPRFDDRFESLSASRAVQLVRSEFDATLVAESVLVIAATGDPDVNARVAAHARQNRVLCNVVDDPRHCSFIMPAVVQRGDVTIAISTAGSAPVLARRIKARIEEMLPARIAAVAEFARRWRPQVQKTLRTMTQRRRLWEDVFDGDIASHVLAGRDVAANRAMTERLSTPRPTEKHGEAWLVGAGPGDPGLITLRGKQLLASADMVLYDRLVSREVLGFARRDAELLFVGKQPGESSTQQRIIDLLLQHVRAGKRVCRLKGGDPLVFGRGGEEIEALQAAGLRYEIVPGITAALACAAYAGIPLTHRSLAHAVWLGTGQRAAGQDSTDWGALASGGQTLALYMSAGCADEVASRLQEHGLDSATPAAVVENGTRPEQRVLRTTLGRLADHVRQFDVISPAILFIGAAAGLAGLHGWFAPGQVIDCNRDNALDKTASTAAH